MQTLLKLQVLTTSLTTIGVWSNLYIQYNDKYNKK